MKVKKAVSGGGPVSTRNLHNSIVFLPEYPKFNKTCVLA